MWAASRKQHALKTAIKPAAAQWHVTPGIVNHLATAPMLAAPGKNAKFC